MKKGLSIFMALCVLVTGTVALGGCRGDKSSNKSEIIVGIAQDLEDSLDPHRAVAAGTKEVLFNVFEGLLKPDSEGNIVPAVAESYTVSDDLLTYSFSLRDGVKFHNGNPVTAEDVKYSIEKSAGMTGEESLIAAFSNIESVAIDGNTVNIKLKEADVDFPTYIANCNASIIPKDNDNPSGNPIGTGPYMYVSRSPQENLIFKKFDEYWGSPANIENVTFKVVPDGDSIVMNLMGGSVDMFAHLTTAQVNQLNKGFNKLEGTMNLVQALYLNNDFEPFSDVNVRRALCYAIDVQGILDLTSDGMGTPIGSSIFPAFKKYYEDLSSAYPHDEEKAKQLLKEAGYPDGFSFSITVPSNYQPHIDTAQVIVEQLEKVGVKASIKLVEWNTWLSDVYSGRQYEATVIGVDASSMTARALLERFNSSADNNFINFENDEYDSLYKKVIVTADEQEQIELYKKMARILSDEAANVYIQDMAEFVVLSEEFDGYKFYPLYVQDIASLYIKE